MALLHQQTRRSLISNCRTPITQLQSRLMESDPLLPETRAVLGSNDNLDPTREAEIRKTLQSSPTLRQRLRAIIANQTYRITASIFFIHFLLEFRLLAHEIPESRLFEHAVCRRYYRENPIASEISEHLCKIAPIQKEVALLVGWRDSFWAVPSTSMTRIC